MNNVRRNKIAQIIREIETMKLGLELIRDEEQESFDNRPECLQASEAGEKSQEVISALEDAIDSLESIGDSLVEVI